MKYNEALLTIRQNLINVFKRYEYIVLPILRFALSFSALRMLKDATAYDGILSGMIAMITFSLIGAFASAEIIELCSIFLVALFLLPTNPIMAILLFLALGMVYILYGRLFPRESILIIATLIAFSIKMELMIPIAAALFGSYASIVAIIIATIIWFVVPGFRMALPMTSLQKDDILDTLNQLLSMDYKELISNQTMMIMIIIFFTVFSAIYIIRKQAIDYGPYIAIGVGAVMNIIGFGLATIFFENVDINLISVITETLVFSFIACVMQYLSIALDYQRAETVSFEDDDNYYYVKIIPKIKLNFKQKKVKKSYTDLSQNNSYNKMMMDHDDYSNGI